MRKSTLVSMLILCGSTAALAQVKSPTPGQTTNNSMANMHNDMAPMPGDEMTPPMQTPDNGMIKNEANPKPM